MPELPLHFPLGPPEPDGGEITVDVLLQDVNLVTRVISNIALQKFFVDRVFAPAGPISGGAQMYEQATENDLYAARDVQRVEPGREFPIISFERPEVKTAQVEKFGGKFPVTDEARRRNRQGPINKAMLQLGNTIRRKTQQRALGELTAAVTEFSRTMAGTSWVDAAQTAEADKVPVDLPIADLTAVEEANEELELGYVYDLAIMNPSDWRNFRLAAGGKVADARALLADSGIKDVWRTNRKAAGSIYWLAERQVGELGFEVPLSTEKWRDADGKQQDWLQAFVLPIVYVTDPFAILETTGHGVDNS